MASKEKQKHQNDENNPEKVTKKKIVKRRNWTFILYPESAPVGWRSQLQESGITACISPLHDQDINPTGEPKKPHYHIILNYPGPTTYNAVSDFTASLNATIPRALESVRGMYRYFTHQDNPEKAQYEPDEIQSVNGFNIRDFVELSTSEVIATKKKIQEFIRKYSIQEYSDLLDILLDNGMDTEYDVACSHTMFFNIYLTSRRCSEQKKAQALGELELERARLERIAKGESVTRQVTEE